MTVKKTFDVINNRVIIDLPENFKGKTKVIVTLEDEALSKDEKFLKMIVASKDPLFLADIDEINDDFNAIDNE